MSFCLVVIGITVFHHKDPVIKMVYPKLVKKDKNATTTAPGKNLPPPTLPPNGSNDGMKATGERATDIDNSNYGVNAASMGANNKFSQITYHSRTSEIGYGTSV